MTRVGRICVTAIMICDCNLHNILLLLICVKKKYLDYYFYMEPVFAISWSNNQTKHYKTRIYISINVFTKLSMWRLSFSAVFYTQWIKSPKINLKVWRSAFMLKVQCYVVKIYSYRLLFRRFFPLGNC